MTQNNTQGLWRTISPLNTARSHSPVAHYQGKLYVFGGGGPNFKSLNSTVCYDPNKQTWAELSPMPTLRSGAVTAVLGEKIYVMGGGFRKEGGSFDFLTAVDIYHPETDTWSKGPDLLQRHDYPAVATLDGKLYVLGGHHPDATQGGPKTDPGFDFCERLDPEVGQWEQIPSLPTPRFALSADVIDGKIMVSGGVAFRPEGFNNFTVIEIYDPTTNEWTSTDEFQLPWPAAGHGTAVVNEQLYVFGGYSDDDIHPRTSRYSFSDNCWHACNPMPAPAAAMGVAVCNGKIYSVGGWADDGRTPTNTVYEFQPD